MILVIVTMIMGSAASIGLVKVADTHLQMGEFHTNLVPNLVICLIAVYTGIKELQMLNLAIKLYDQMEVLPIQQVCRIFSWTFTGLYLYDEHFNYTNDAIMRIFGSALICLAGVIILTFKRRI